MKINFKKNEVIKDIENNNNNSYDNILELKNCDNSNSFRSNKNNLSLNNSY